MESTPLLQAADGLPNPNQVIQDHVREDASELRTELTS